MNTTTLAAMRRGGWAAGFVAALLGAGAARAGVAVSATPAVQPVSRPAPPAGPTWLTLSPPESVTLTAGHGTVVRLLATVKPGFHVQAHATREGFIPTAVKLIAVGPVSFGNPVYPKGRPFRLEGDTEYLNVYEGAFAIGLPVRVSSKTPPGTYTFTGSLEYQACDLTACFPPRSAPFTVSVLVAK